MRWFFIILVVLCPTASLAEYILIDVDPSWGRITKQDYYFNVIFEDDVSDGCWKNPQAAADAVKLELLRSGYNVSDESKTWITVYLSSIGYQTNEQLPCFVSYELQAIETDYDQIWHEQQLAYHWEFKTIFRDSGILSGGDTTARLKDVYIELAQRFILAHDEGAKTLKSAIMKAARENGVAEVWQSYEVD